MRSYCSIATCLLKIKKWWSADVRRCSLDSARLKFKLKKAGGEMVLHALVNLLTVRECEIHRIMIDLMPTCEIFAQLFLKWPPENHRR